MTDQLTELDRTAGDLAVACEVARERGDENERLRAVAEAAVDYMTAGSEGDADLAYKAMDETLDVWRAGGRDE